MAYEHAENLSNLWDGEMKGIHVHGIDIVLIRKGEKIFAYEDLCPHQQVPLSEGTLNGCELTCRAHQWQFNICTGKGINPSEAVLRSFPVNIHGTEITIDIKGTKL